MYLKSTVLTSWTSHPMKCPNPCGWNTLKQKSHVWRSLKLDKAIGMLKERSSKGLCATCLPSSQPSFHPHCPGECLQLSGPRAQSWLHNFQAGKMNIKLMSLVRSKQPVGQKVHITPDNPRSTSCQNCTVCSQHCIVHNLHNFDFRVHDQLNQLASYTFWASVNLPLTGQLQVTSEQ